MFCRCLCSRMVCPLTCSVAPRGVADSDALAGRPSLVVGIEPSLRSMSSTLGQVLVRRVQDLAARLSALLRKAFGRQWSIWMPRQKTCMCRKLCVSFCVKTPVTVTTLLEVQVHLPPTGWVRSAYHPMLLTALRLSRFYHRARQMFSWVSRADAPQP